MRREESEKLCPWPVDAAVIVLNGRHATGTLELET